MSEFCIMIGIMIIMYPFLVIALTAKSDKKIYSSRGYLLTLRDKRHFCARRGGGKNSNIWFDGGSNVRFSIDACLVAQALRRNVYVIADYYYIPWRLRFYNLLSYLNTGDVLVLSLEFFQYAEEYNISKIFRNILKKKEPNIYGVLGLYCDYINSPAVPFWYKYAQSFFVHPVLLKYFWKMSLHRGDMTELFRREPELYSVRVETGHENEYSVITHPAPRKICPMDPNQPSGVDRVLKNNRFKIRERMQTDLNILKKIQEKGVRIFWSWPVAIWTGKNLAENVKEREEFEKEVRNLIQSYGIKFLGNLEDYIYAVDAQHEGNVYHVNAKYQKIHTEKLIDLLKL